jgi:hypothetical protein
VAHERLATRRPEEGSVTTYAATCRRDGAYWRVEVAGQQRSALAARLCQVEGVARQLATGSATPADDEARVTVELQVPHRLQTVIEEATAARQAVDELSPDAVAARSELARRLAAEGCPVRDVAFLLGISYGRAAQLVGDRRRGTTPRKPLLAAAAQ